MQPAAKNLPTNRPFEGISPKAFMNIVATINQSTTLDSLFNSAMEVSPVTTASYHHLPSVGAIDYKSLGRYYAYKIPEVIEDHYKNFNPHQPDPGLVATFAKGHFIWLSDLANEPIVVEAGHKNMAIAAIKIMGDGLCIPLFGPKNRRGYMFVAGELSKSETGPYLPYQVQALAQLLHLRFCLMVENLQKQIRLTPREAEVLELLTFGNTNQEIAKSLGISVSTVSGYVKSVFIKLGVSDRVSASMRAQSMQITF